MDSYEKILEAKNRYMRKWRKDNPERSREIQRNYARKRAAEFKRLKALENELKEKNSI